MSLYFACIKQTRIHFFWVGGMGSNFSYPCSLLKNQSVSDFRSLLSEVMAGCAILALTASWPNLEAWLSGLCHQQQTPLSLFSFAIQLLEKVSFFSFFIPIKKL